MTKVPSEWFGNPRPLPLDENGKVDFSKEIETLPSFGDDSLTNPIRGGYFISLDMHNRLSMRQVVFLPNWHSIIVASTLSNGSALSAYDSCHNIFRLDANGNVVWQVQRDEQGKLYPKDWELRSERRNKNFERKHQGPFARLSTKFIKRGVFIEFEPTPAKHESPIWKPDYVLLAWVYGRGVYELDIETGIAKNVTQPGGRDW